MNIFCETSGFFGNYNKGEEKELSNKFWSVAREIREELGEDGYILDTYLSEIFNVLDQAIISNIIDEVDEMINKLYFLCKNIVEYKPIEKQDELYKKVYNYIATHHLPYKESDTRFKLYMLFLVDDFTDIFIEKIHNEIDRNFIVNSNSDVIKDNFERISKKVGEQKMENLNTIIKKKFAMPTIFDIFRRAVGRNLLYYLNSKDQQTSKQNFQLILENSNLF